MASESCSQRYEYRDMASRSKAAYSERKRPKSTFILTVNRPYLSIIQGKENRLSHRPISSAKGTGGLNFLIADALLILCHSLFEVVIDDIAEGCELVVAMGTVYTVIHRNKVNIMFGKHDLGIHTDLQIITPETRHIFDDNTLDKACLNICNHLLKARAVKGRTGNAIINIEFEVGISVFKSILLQDFFLENDLSRVFFTQKHV